MTTKALLDDQIDEYQTNGYARVDIFMGPDVEAEIKRELFYLMMFPTETGRRSAYRGCAVFKMDRAGFYLVAFK